jgi:hypothetical protein
MSTGPPSSAEERGFLSRWAKRKEAARRGDPVESAQPATAPARAAVLQPVAPEVVVGDAAAAAPADPLPTLADVELLTRDSDYSRFVGAGVDNGVNQAAMKKLFADPHFNVMDGLDTYIDDYGKPDPIPLAMLRLMNQSKVLRLFDDDDDESADGQARKPAADTAPAEPVACQEPPARTDDHADLQLQQHDDAGRPGPDQGVGA